MTLNTESLWSRLADPVETAVLQTGIARVLHQCLDGVDLSSSVDAMEYADHYADADVKAAHAFALDLGLIAADVPTIVLKPHCGLLLKTGDIANFFQASAYRELAQNYSTWEAEHGPALTDRFMQAYVEGGDAGLLQALYTTQP